MKVVPLQPTRDQQYQDRAGIYERADTTFSSLGQRQAGIVFPNGASGLRHRLGHFHPVAAIVLGQVKRAVGQVQPVVCRSSAFATSQTPTLIVILLPSGSTRLVSTSERSFSAHPLGIVSARFRQQDDKLLPPVAAQGIYAADIG